jgi:hypothetical protein
MSYITKATEIFFQRDQCKRIREYTDSANVHYVHHVMSCPMIRRDMNMEVLNMNMFIMCNDNEYEA